MSPSSMFHRASVTRPVRRKQNSMKSCQFELEQRLNGDSPAPKAEKMPNWPTRKLKSRARLRRGNECGPISRRPFAGGPERLPSGRAGRCWRSWSFLECRRANRVHAIMRSSLRTCCDLARFSAFATIAAKAPGGRRVRQGNSACSCRSRCRATCRISPDRCETCGKSVAAAAGPAGSAGCGPRRGA